LPPFVAGLTLGDADARVTLTAALIHVIEGWAEGYVNAGQLPAIDWSVFPAEAAARGPEALAVMSEMTKEASM
jgi:hypothetical protein